MSDYSNPYQSPTSELNPNSNLSHNTQNYFANFKDPTLLTKTVLGLLIAGIALSVISWGCDLMELRLLKALQEGGEITENFQGQLENSDTRQSIVGTLALALFIAQAISILMWIYRANDNARQLGAHDMQFTPGWSVGYYFIPILNLWKPYQAMKEIFLCSQSVSQRPEKSGEGVIVCWWFLWLTSSMIGNYLMRATFATDDPSLEQLINLNQTTQVATFADILLSITLFIIVRKIYRMQIAH